MTTLSLPIYINSRTDLHPGGKVELTGAAVTLFEVHQDMALNPVFRLGEDGYELIGFDLVALPATPTEVTR